ncbi:hypothetical protein [Variovorax sp. W2I14]|uniref:hypothetical protein n=1 Tax=Variovorax sp. W2I14 TaxID=3042290 RepID=UPI003D1DDA78
MANLNEKLKTKRVENDLEMTPGFGRGGGPSKRQTESTVPDTSAQRRGGEVEAVESEPVSGALPVNPQDVIDLGQRYAQRYGAQASQWARKHLEALPVEAQLFYLKFAEDSNARIEDIAIEISAAHELHKLSEKTIANLRSVVERQSSNLAGMLEQEEKIFETIGRRVEAVNAELNESLDAVLQHVVQAMELLDKKNAEIEEKAKQTLANLSLNLEPHKLSQSIVAEHSEAAGVIIGEKVLGYIKSIAKREAAKQVESQWHRKGWLVNLMWLLGSIAACTATYILK